MRRPTISLLLSILILLLIPQLLLAGNKPIPGIDVIVRKKPGGSAMTVHILTPGETQSGSQHMRLENQLYRVEFILSGAEARTITGDVEWPISIETSDANGDGVDDLTITLFEADDEPQGDMASDDVSARRLVYSNPLLQSTDDIDGDGLPEYIFEGGAADAAGLLAHYFGVRMQQGRVQLDADWNEQAALQQDRVNRPTFGCSLRLLQDLLEGLADGSVVAGRNRYFYGKDFRAGSEELVNPFPDIDIIVRDADGSSFVLNIEADGNELISYNGHAGLGNNVRAGAEEIPEGTDVREVALVGPDTTTRSSEGVNYIWTPYDDGDGDVNADDLTVPDWRANPFEPHRLDTGSSGNAEDVEEPMQEEDSEEPVGVNEDEEPVSPAEDDGTGKTEPEADPRPEPDPEPVPDPEPEPGPKPEPRPVPPAPEDGR